MNAALKILGTLMQFATGLTTPILAVAGLRWYVKPRPRAVAEAGREPSSVDRFVRTILLAGLSAALGGIYWLLPASAAIAVGVATDSFASAGPPTNPAPMLAFLLVHAIATVIGYVWVARQGTETSDDLHAFGGGVRVRFKILQLLGTGVVLGLSLLPLSALLLAFPAIMPQESVLTESVGRPGFWLRTFRRATALISGFVVFLVILACSVELVSRLPLGDRGSFAVIPRTLLFAPGDLQVGKTETQRKEAIDNISSVELRTFLRTPLHEKLPPAMVEHWQFVFLAIYGFDVLLLLFIGKVPLAYNLRNVRVRWKTNAMTAVAFASVIALLSFLLAFVNGMNNLTENSGVPGNVFVLSDGSTDEIFSYLDKEDMGNLGEEKVVLDERDAPLKKGPIVIRKMDVAGKAKPMASWETYYSINQPILNDGPEAAKPESPWEWFAKYLLMPSLVFAAVFAAAAFRVFRFVGAGAFDGLGVKTWIAAFAVFAVAAGIDLLIVNGLKTPARVPDATEGKDPAAIPRRRFVQLRTLDDPAIAAAVHDVTLVPGGRWMGETGVETDPQKPEKFKIECVLGEGIAETLGPDYGKKRLGVDDTFELGEMQWRVTGIMKSEGKTFGSEIWARRIGLIHGPFGKPKPTTLVLRTDDDTKRASRLFAHELNARYTKHKLRAFSEPDYYAELTKTNNFFLTAIILVCVVMAIGGVFGMMTTMFATIAQRIRDIGVLRLLGFKRWQVTVSFLLESLAVATVGGALGCAFAWLVADGRSSVSMLSAGGNGPGGKSVALTINVDAQVAAMGMLFTLVMGRLGGLVPALSAMRIKILDSLR